MEVEASVEGRPRRREHRNGGGRFRAEIEMDRGSSAIPRGREFGFAAAVREPLVRLQRPKYDFERWDWDYFAWPHDRLDANLEMRDSDPDATLEADRKASESFLNRSTLQLENYAMDQYTQEQHAAAWPLNQLGVNLDTRKDDPEAAESFLNQSRLQLERCEMDQHRQGKHAAAWPHDPFNIYLEMRNSNPGATLEARQSFQSRSTLQLEMCETEQHTQEQEKEETELRTSLIYDNKPVGRRSTWRHHGCAEANGIMHHRRPMQGSWAC